MKPCPRCKTTLLKSHSQKMICRACGFVTRDLEVVRENQQFQERHNFNKKITMIRNENETIKFSATEQLRNHYLASFQNMLRSTAKFLSKRHHQCKDLEPTVRQIWLTYCSLAAQNRRHVAGIFTALFKTQTHPISPPLQHDQQPQIQDRQQPHSLTHKPLEESEEPVRKRKGRPKKKGLAQCLSTNEEKKIPLLTQLRRQFKRLQIKEEEGLSLSELREHFLDFICHHFWNEAEADIQTINYMAHKYALLVVRQIYQGFGELGVSQAKGRPFRLINKQLEGVMKLRGLNIKQRRQIILVIFLEDLLRKWSSRISLSEEHSLQNLFLLYCSEENGQPSGLISSTLNYLKKVMPGGEEEARTHEDSFPKLSLNLAYAIMYVGNLINCNTLSIDDIVLSTQEGLNLEFRGEKIVSEEKVCPSQIRKTAAKLVKEMEIRHQPTIASLANWLRKYAQVCGLMDSIPQILQLSQILFKGLQVLQKQQINQESSRLRNQFIEQDIMAKSIIVIFLKLETGFQTYPYLLTTPPNLVQKMQVASNAHEAKFVEFLQTINEPLNPSISKILNKLQLEFGHHSQRSRNLKQKYSIKTYSSLQFLSLSQLKELTRRNQTSNFNLGVHLGKRKFPKSPPHPLCLVSTPKCHLTLSRPFRKQMEIAMEEKKNNTFDPRDLDLPSSNYEFFYEYESNIRHADRDLFVLFVETFSAGECSTSNFYAWIEILEKVVVDFEN